MRLQQLAQAAAEALSDRVMSCRALSGGDLSQVITVDLAASGTVVAKTGSAPQVEAGMLQAIARAGGAVPGVLAVHDDILVLEYLPERGGLAPSGWAALGAMLRTLHDTPGDRYGWPQNYAFGPMPIDNRACDDWPTFWAERRLLAERHALPLDFAHRLEAVAERLSVELPARPVPGLLHGDLWGGNVLAFNGQLRGLIDPACYHGDGEVDLAMLHLFGTPDAAFHEAYGRLLPGWQRRRAIYTLWPAIVHVRLFGAAYHGMLDLLLTGLER